MQLIIILILLCTRAYAAYITPEQFRELKQQALRGDIDSIYQVAWCYEKGEGCPKNLVEAYAFFNVASVSNGLARLHIGMTLEAIMTPKDITEAQKRSLELQNIIDENLINSAANKPTVVESADKPVISQFTTNVLWESLGPTGPQDPSIRNLNWKIISGNIYVRDPASDEWVKFNYLNQMTIDGDLGLMHRGRLSNGSLLSLTLIKSGVKFYYSLATMNAPVEHIIYGPCKSELVIYFKNHTTR